MREKKIVTYTASGALAYGQIVKFHTSDGVVTAASAATDKQIGTVESPNGAADGDRVDICRQGFPDVLAGGNITRGDLVTTDSNGAAVAATRHTHTENTAVSYAQNATTGGAPSGRILGIAEVNAASGDLFECLLAPGFN